MKQTEMAQPTADKEVLSWVQNDYVIRVFDRISALPQDLWAALLDAERGQGRPSTPFMTPAYLAALQDSGCASPETGWTLHLVTLWRPAAPSNPSTGSAADCPPVVPTHPAGNASTPPLGNEPENTPGNASAPPFGDEPARPSGNVSAHPPANRHLCAACVLYVKPHSYGEYVFDWAWADAYHRHGLAYYPKGVVAVPFTPVPGPRLLAVDADARLALCSALIRLSEQLGLSSLHLLFAQDADVAAAQAAGLLLRQTVQFHWENTAGWPDFDAFLASLNQEKRKKIKQERRKVREAGVQFHTLHGHDITDADWDFFYRCYERTYLEHGNSPYLSRAFFAALAATQPDNWLLCVATWPDESGEARTPIACSLIAVSSIRTIDGGQKGIECEPRVAYGRYWGALERVDSLHFEACYYQPIEWCLANGYTRFEGGAQGEHKMARALMPVQTTSAHWLAHPAFAEAIDRYLQREGEGMAHYMTDLAQRTPFKRPAPSSGA